MKINFDDVLLLLTFIGGLIFLLIGIKAKKAAEKRQAGILSIFLAICMFVFFILAVFSQVLKVNHSWLHIISIIQLIIAGMLLGICLAMEILGHWKLLKKPRKSSSEDSQTGNLK